MLLKHKHETVEGRVFVATHPLDDKPEMKRDLSQLGRMKITPAVRRSLIVLRAYLVLMAVILLYHVIDLAAVVRK